MRKLDNKAKKCIFIGYKDGMKVYTLWNPVTKNIVYSRDVVFREAKEVPRHEVTLMEKESKKMDLTQQNKLNQKKKKNLIPHF